MKIAIGSDHGGYALKQELIQALSQAGYEMMDVGTFSQDSCDYPVFSIKVGEAVRDKKAQFGILVCRSGVGMAMAANKVKTVRAALCLTERMAELARTHNDANVLSLGADLVDIVTAEKIALAFLRSPFEGGRHARRVEQIIEYEKTHT